jgi:hypothetical protein
VNPLARIAGLCLAGALAGCLAGSLTGCLAGTGDECTADADCSRDGECTRTGECVPDGGAVRIEVRWTVNGVAPSPSSPEPCAAIGELEILFLDPGGEEENFRPVPCDLGQSVFDKMPPRFESVEVIAYDEDEGVLDSTEQELAAGDSVVEVDLVPMSAL